MSARREILVGTVIIVAVIVAVFGTLWLQGTNWGRPSIEVQVLLTDVAQLGEGDAVKYRGVNIGQVDAIEVDEGGQAVRLTLLLDAGVVLPDDPVVVVAPESLFGSWQAEIVARDRYPSFTFYDVPEGETVSGARVLGGYALPELSRLTASAEQISDNVATLSERFEVAFNDQTAASLAQAIDNMEAISQEIRELVAQQSELAMSVTSNADSALAEIEGASRAARRSFERLDAVLTDAELDSIMENVRLASASIQEIAANLTGSSADLSGTLAKADSAFTRLDRLAARVEGGEGALGRLMADSTLAVRAEDVLAQLDLLLQDLRENPRRYVRLSIF
jgi:phospholipid/cholesterol/gamma-HCH transport system substrate-binding protein